jgi:hypothetical protein
MSDSDSGIEDKTEFMVDDFIGLVVENISLDSEIIFTTSDKKKIRMYHQPDCCESVVIHSVENLNYLIYNKILQVEEIFNDESYDPKKEKMVEEYDHFSWTFYNFTTTEGVAKIIWFGSSNGYYDEGVQLEYICDKNEDKNKE